MIILGIETSCDDTAIGIVENIQGNLVIHVHVLSSQIKTHFKYGGIVPNLAARNHIKNLPLVLKRVLKQVKMTMNDIDAIAVASGPGLIPALLVGVSFAKALAFKYSKPLIGINHMEGHVYSNWLSPVTVHNEKKKRKSKKNSALVASKLSLNDTSIFPALNLIVSGGHTQLILMKDHHKYKLLGGTIDDAAGEAFDKIGRILELPFPGGPHIAAEAAKLKVKNHKLKVQFPRPMIYHKNYDFSFSGLKTAVLYKVRDLTNPTKSLRDNKARKYELSSIRPVIAYEAQEAIVDVLITKTKRATKEYPVKSLMLCGGVSANKVLRTRLQELGQTLNIPVYVPPMTYATDNGAMIAGAALAQIMKHGTWNIKHKSKKIKYSIKNILKIQANANWEIV